MRLNIVALSLRCFFSSAFRRRFSRRAATRYSRCCCLRSHCGSLVRLACDGIGVADCHFIATTSSIMNEESSFALELDLKNMSRKKRLEENLGSAKYFILVGWRGPQVNNCTATRTVEVISDSNKGADYLGIVMVAL